MKLSKFICKRITMEYHSGQVYQTLEDDIEHWLAEWYRDIFDKDPPVWLAGKRWYDRRKRIIKEAEENESTTDRNH